MLLLIPAIEITQGRCAQNIRGAGGYVYSDDPVEMARLWRKENAKSLHVTDLDGARDGRIVNAEVIRRVVESVDIPVELGRDLRGIDTVRQALDLGVYRVAVGSMVTEDPDRAKELIDTFGASKIVLGIDAMDGVVVARGQDTPSGLSALSVGLNARMLGFRRILYTEIRKDEALRGVNLTILQKLGENTGMRITAAGGIGGLEDLLRIQALERYGVDSVIVGRALYENKFSCQAIWRMCEAGNYPYTAKV